MTFAPLIVTHATLSSQRQFLEILLITKITYTSIKFNCRYDSDHFPFHWYLLAFSSLPSSYFLNRREILFKFIYFFSTHVVAFIFKTKYSFSKLSSATFEIFMCLFEYNIYVTLIKTSFII